MASKAINLILEESANSLSNKEQIEISDSDIFILRHCQSKVKRSPKLELSLSPQVNMGYILKLAKSCDNRLILLDSKLVAL